MVGADSPGMLALSESGQDRELDSTRTPGHSLGALRGGVTSMLAFGCKMRYFHLIKLWVQGWDAEGLLAACTQGVCFLVVSRN